MLEQQLQYATRGAAVADVTAAMKMHVHDIGRGAPLALPKRVDWVAMVDRQLSTCRRFGTSMAVLSIGIDGLDDIEQRYGKEVRERLLQLVWARLRSRLRSTDQVALVGEQEFGAMVLDVTGAAAMAVHARVADALCAPYRLGAQVLAMPVGTGAAFYPQAGSTGETLAHMARQARMLRNDD